jgi:hypothetical protein
MPCIPDYRVRSCFAQTSNLNLTAGELLCYPIALETQPVKRLKPKDTHLIDAAAKQSLPETAASPLQKACAPRGRSLARLSS